MPAVDSELLAVEVHHCSPLLKANLSPLFPGMDLAKVNMNAITLSHRTQNNIFDWDENMAAEREQLAESFIGTAMDMCNSLRELGFWADFINPYTGKPVSYPAP